MKPSRDLDKRIAREVLNLQDMNGFFIELDCPHYSVNISSAWLVVQKLEEKYAVSLNSTHPGWQFNITQHGTMKTLSFTIQDTAPLAICVAALRLIEEN